MEEFRTGPSCQIAHDLGRLLDACASVLALGKVEQLKLPDDEIHREILLPLLPAMICDPVIQKHWIERAATGFVARMKAGSPPPRWDAADFEIHVTASYLAGADARALADTLLSEPSFRELTATMMNVALTRVLAGAKEAMQVMPVAALAASRGLRRRFSLNKSRYFLRRTLR